MGGAPVANALYLTARSDSATGTPLSSSDRIPHAKKDPENISNGRMADRTGLEPVTFGVTSRRYRQTELTVLVLYQ